MNERNLNAQQWVDRYGDQLYRFALLRVQNQSAAEDLVQDTFIAAFKSRDSFRRDSSEETWLVGILKHKIIDYLRTAGRTVPLDDLDSSGSSKFLNQDFNEKKRWKTPLKKWENTPETTAESAAFNHVLEECLGDLPERLKQLFLLRELDEVQTDEICKVFNITPTNLWVLLHRTRNQLKNCLEKKWFK